MATTAQLAVSQKFVTLLEEALSIGGTSLTASGSEVLTKATATSVLQYVKKWTKSTDPAVSDISEVLRQVESECRRYEKLVKEVEHLVEGAESTEGKQVEGTESTEGKQVEGTESTDYTEVKEFLSNLVQLYQYLHAKLQEVKEDQPIMMSKVQEEIEILCDNVEKAVYEMECHVHYLKMEIRISQTFQLIYHEEAARYKSLMKETFSDLGIEYQDDVLDRCLKTVFHLSVAKELSTFSEQKYASWDGDKNEVKEYIWNQFQKMIDLAKKEHIKNKKTGAARHHVINNGVLKIHKDIVYKCRQARKIRSFYVDLNINQPLKSPLAYGFVATTAVQLNGNERQTPDINSFLFGVANCILIEWCVSHMTIMYYNRRSTEMYDNRRAIITKTSANIKWLCKRMNRCHLIAGEPIFVDQEALKQWLLEGGKRGDYIFAKENVQNMFNTLCDKMNVWVSLPRNLRRNIP